MTTSKLSPMPQEQVSDGSVVRRRIVASRRSRNGLLQFARNETSQNGEDGILEYLFATALPARPKRWCVDVGAWDGVHWSNTHSLLVGASSNWRGVLIESNLEKSQQLKALHEPLGNTSLGVTVSGTEGNPDSLAVLLKKVREKQQQQKIAKTETESDDVLPLDFDFLCIDIDGMDYWVLRDILEHSEFRPQVICIEFNPTMPDDLIYIPPRTESRHGCSLAALCELLCSDVYHYVLVETTLYNAFFVPRSLYEQSTLAELVPDTSIEALHEISMGTSLYQLYDGTLKLWGCQKLLWHRIPIQESKIQMLPPKQRLFPFAPPESHTGMDSNALYREFEENHTVIDVSPWCIGLASKQPGDDDDDDNAKRRSDCARALLEQLQQDGFAYIRAPLDPELCQSALQLTGAFLQDASEGVRRSCLAKDRARRGYSPMCTENFASLLGVSNVKNDLVRKFRIGPPVDETAVAMSGQHHHHHQQQQQQPNSLLQPNIWPSDETWEQSSDFRQTMEHYYQQAVVAANGVVSAVCQALIEQDAKLQTSLEPLLTTVEPKSTGSNQPPGNSSILTLLGYCNGARHKQSKKKREPLVAAHTDVGVVTMLLFDQGDCGSLQRIVKKNSGVDTDSTAEWENVILPPVVIDKDPIFVLNVADCLSELSCGRLPSTLHRVVAGKSGGQPRNGCALFVGLEPSQRLTFLDGKDSVTSRTITFEEWRKERITRAQRAMQQSTK